METATGGDLGEYEVYVHDRPQLTIGDLRVATDGLPDHLPLRVYAPITPGEPAELELAVVGTGHGWERDDTGDERIDPALGLVCDFVSGEHALEPGSPNGPRSTATRSEQT